MDELKDDNQKQELTDTEPQSEDKIDGDIDPDNNLQFAINPIGAAFIGLIGSFFLYQIVGGTLTFLVFGMDLESAPVNEFRLMTIGGQILFILLPALVFAKIFYTDVGKIIRINIPGWQEVLLFIIGLIILTPLLQSFLYIQNYYIDILAKNVSFVNSIKSFFDVMNEMLEKTYGDLLKASNIFELIFVVIVIAVTPAIAEEAMFRGFIQRSFELKLKPVLAILLTGFFFSANHFNPYGLIPLFMLGSYFGFAAYMSRSLVIPVALHFLNNFSAVFMYHFLGDDELLKSNISIKPDELSSLVAMFLVLSVLFSGLIILIIKYYSSKKIITEV